MTPQQTKQQLTASPSTPLPDGNGAMKRAVIYIRVSTKQQAVRDGNPEGYSLPTQRQACTFKAGQLGADVVEEYVDKDSGTAVSKRPAMQRLIERARTQQDVDYVIVHKLDRFARNRYDDAMVTARLQAAGARLVSCVESIDDTAGGQLVQGMMAVVNEFHSRNMGDEIKRKTLQKIMEGGTHGNAPLGYKNVGEGGRRFVIVDEEPARLIRWAFAAYVTSEWSVKDLLAEVTKRGLRSKGGPNIPKKELSISQMHRILARPYYKGIVVYNGVQYQGKHEPLVDEETWQRVQDMLASKANGEKQREHHHYLKGTIYCGHCGSRLCVTYAKGKMGVVYPYYFCVGRQQKRTTCMLKSRPIALVEEQIEDHYRIVQLTAEGLTETGAAIMAELADQEAMLTTERQHQATRLRQLEDERTKLLHAHYAGAVPLDLLKTEQQRITDELASVKGVLAAATASFERVQDTVAKAVAWAENCRLAYLESGPHGRRLMNQAFFKRVLVTEEGVVDWEYNQPFATLMQAHGAPTTKAIVVTDPIAASATAGKKTRGYERRSPGQLTRAFSATFSCASLKQTHLAEGVGFEPTEGCPSHDFQSCRFGRSRIPPGPPEGGSGQGIVGIRR
jgi:site-specific DNA recombinase